MTTRSRNAIMDERSLGFLRFTTACAKFDLEVLNPVLDERHPEDCAVCKEWTRCCIRAHTGKSLGSIRVPASWFSARNNKKGEFILLSMHIVIDIEDDLSETCQPGFEEETLNEGKLSSGIKHMDGCEHQSMYNVMLIDWKEGPHCDVAIRINVTQIHKDDWNEAKAIRKEIVLG